MSEGRVDLRVAMTCGGCKSAVERVLGRKEGVQSFEVDMDAQKVSVVAVGLTAEEILDTVAKTGKATSVWA